jgi:inosine-uridine nucleoside N-ribohydrolase
VALDPGVVTCKSRHAVDVECEGVLTRGMTVVDQLDAVSRGLGDTTGWSAGVTGADPPVTVCWEIDVARFKERLFRALA